VSKDRIRVAVAGAGGMGREALAWLCDARPDVDPVAFFVADATELPHGFDVGLPVVDSIADLAKIHISAAVVGIGDGRRRRMVTDELSRAGIEVLSVVHPTAFCGPGVAVGSGSILAPGVVLTRDVTIGCGVIVNYQVAVGHDCRIRDFAFLGPGAVLTGDVQIGSATLIGAGAIILPGRMVGNGARVAAGAVVTRDVAEDVVVMGNPAQPISVASG
jgi:sugar O-acyltransferase (sialic acid O-acetyltransferase NeuD family)